MTTTVNPISTLRHLTVLAACLAVALVVGLWAPQVTTASAAPAAEGTGVHASSHRSMAGKAMMSRARRASISRARRRRRREEEAAQPPTTTEPTTSPTTEPTSTPTPTTPAPAPSEPEPAPAPTPAPTAPAPAPEESATSADLLFEGTRISSFWLNQSAPGAVSEVADPAGSGETVFKMTVNDNDVYPITPTGDPRAQLLTPNSIVSGQEFWWSAKFLLPADFPSSVPGWVTVMQGAYGPPFNGTPPWHLEISGSELRWQRNSTYGWDIPWRMPVPRNRWVKVLLHEGFGTNGFVEMWIDGQQVTFFDSGSYNPNHEATSQRLAMKTMDASNNGGANEMAIQSYRKRGMFQTVTLFQGPARLGRTRASVGG